MYNPLTDAQLVAAALSGRLSAFASRVLRRHDHPDVKCVCSRVLVPEHGTIRREGPVGEILDARPDGLS